MYFHILTLFPEMVLGGLSTSITGRAIKQNKLNIEAVNIRDFSLDKNRRVDDYTYGGGAGMLMQAQPVYDAWKSVADSILQEGTASEASNKKPRTIYVTPQGLPFSQKMAEDFAKEEDLILLCGHYEGIDERVLEEVVTDYVSIGDYVLTGGELAAMVIVDAVSRLVPGVLHNEISAETESFSNGLLEYPQYTRPVEWHKKQVPKLLQGGDTKKINAWRLEKSIERTKERRPDLYESYCKLQTCLSLMMKQKRLHIDMIELINRGRAELIFHEEDEILLRDKKTGIGFHTKMGVLYQDYHAGAGCSLPQILEKVNPAIINEMDSIVTHQRYCMEYFEEHSNWRTTAPCYQAVLTRKEKLPVAGLYHPDGNPMENGLVIRPVPIEYAAVVAKHYHLSVDSPEYVMERVTSGQVFGAFFGEELAGFIGFHDEGSIGMLEVLPQYRRMHIALALETYIMNYALERGMIPYGQIIWDNIVSAKLQEKIGLFRSESMIYWMHDRNGALSNQHGLQEAREEDKEEILSLYRSAIGTEGCTWSKQYPSDDTISFDLSRHSLFCLRDEDRKITGVITIDADEEVEALSCWSKELTPVAELSRLGVRKDLYGQGIAKMLMDQGIKLLKEKGYKAVHFLVAKENTRALAAYKGFDCRLVGECHLFDVEFYCYEREI